MCLSNIENMAKAAVPVGEAMMACVLLDHVLLHRGQIGENRGRIG